MKISPVSLAFFNTTTIAVVAKWIVYQLYIITMIEVGYDTSQATMACNYSENTAMVTTTFFFFFCFRTTLAPDVDNLAAWRLHHCF